MRIIKKLLVNKNNMPNEPIWRLMRDHNVELWGYTDEEIPNPRFKIIDNPHQFKDYSRLALHPEVSSAIEGNVNGRASAEILWDIIHKDKEATSDKEIITKILQGITVNQVREAPGGYLKYSAQYRILIINEQRSLWQANMRGEKNRMELIGDCLTIQGIKWRYLPKSAPEDGSSVLIIALPMPMKKTAQVSIESQIKEQAQNTIEEAEKPVTIPDKKTRTFVTSRNITRKGTKEVDLKSLEEQDQDE
jgi:hypothetical protein